MAIRSMFKSEQPNNPNHKEEFLAILAASLPPVIARSEIGKILGGLIAPKTLANADSTGTGPKKAWAVGKKVVYAREDLIAWLGENFPVQKLENSILRRPAD